MSSVLNGGGLNYQRGNPLGREVRSIQADVAELKKAVAFLKANGGGSQQVVQGPAGPAGPPGPAGPAGPTGPAGPMAYIAMPQGMTMSPTTIEAKVAAVPQDTA
jgi:hypothetical protein